MSENKDWNPDLEFIEFMKHQLEKDGARLDEPFIGCGSDLFTMLDILQQMRDGKEPGRGMYEKLLTYPCNQEYKEYLVSKK